MRKINVRELCFIAIFVALTAVGAQIRIPQYPAPPWTLQAWVISLAGIVLGAKNGTIAAVVYVLLGAVGAPVFAEFSGGLPVLFGRTGGFILSFPLVALLAGIGEGKPGLKGAIWVTAGMIAGVLINWFAGMIQFSFVMGTTLAVAFGFTVLPFIVPGILRVILIPIFGRSIKFALKKGGVKL